MDIKVVVDEIADFIHEKQVGADDLTYRMLDDILDWLLDSDAPWFREDDYV